MHVNLHSSGCLFKLSYITEVELPASPILPKECHMNSLLEFNELRYIAGGSGFNHQFVNCRKIKRKV